MNDEELMIRVREGSPESLGALFERHHLALFRFFCRLGDDRSQSEDLVQEVFYRILKYRRSYRPGSAFRSWMYRIARNARSDSFHKWRDRMELEEASSPAIAPRDDVQTQQEVALLQQALAQLSPDKREVLVLSRFQELKYEEIAAILDCRVGTVKVRVHRALHELKEVFHRFEAQSQVERRPPESNVER